MIKHDKVARIIGLAEELNVKIITKKEKKHDKRSDKHRISHKLLFPDIRQQVLSELSQIAGIYYGISDNSGILRIITRRGL